MSIFDLHAKVIAAGMIIDVANFINILKKIRESLRISNNHTCPPGLSARWISDKPR